MGNGLFCFEKTRELITKLLRLTYHWIAWRCVGWRNVAIFYYPRRFRRYSFGEIKNVLFWQSVFRRTQLVKIGHSPRGTKSFVYIGTLGFPDRRNKP